jgi:hypothetical protein
LPGEQGPLEIEGDFDFDLDLDFDLEGILLFLSFLFYFLPKTFHISLEWMVVRTQNCRKKNPD